MTEPLTAKQREDIAHWNAFNVPVAWFIGSVRDDNSREAIALGDGFAWSLLWDTDGTLHTTEATTGPWETGITI